MNEQELEDYAVDLESLGYDDDYIVNELARVISGENPTHAFAIRIRANTITADQIITEAITIDNGGVYYKW